MPRRIEICVVKISGEREKYPAEELNNQRPTVKGWQSPRFCPYPQVIVLQLEARSRICKFQILSHHYMISTMVELYVGDVPKGMLEVPQNVTWEKLGEIAFSENSLTKYKARELRSALLDVVAKFIKIVLHQNHVNRLNMCNQVGLIALNVIGEIVPEGGSKKDKKLDDVDNSPWWAENISPMEDLSFNTYVDTEVAHLLRILERKKQKAVMSDRFVYAKKLKYAMGELQKVGEKLGKYDIEKQQAIEAEDYDKARIKKEQMEQLRLKEYERLHLPELMEMEGYNPDLDEHNRPKPKRISTPPPRKTPPEEAFVPMLSNFISHDDSVVPALKKGAKSQPSVFAGEDVQTGNNLTFGKMTEKDKREASLPIDVFGLPLVEKMYSKTYVQREDALKEMHQFLSTYQKKGKSHSPGDVVKATTFLLQRALKDKVHSVFSLALDVIKLCFRSFAPQQNVPKIELSFLADKSTPEIINRLGDTAPRMKKLSMDFMIDVANYPEVKSVQMIPHYCLEPIQNTLNIRLAQARCDLVEDLVKKYPPWKFDILPLNKVMPFLVNTLQHPSASVRGIAEHIIIFLYKHQGQPVKTYLPSDTEVSKRNIMYRRIFQELANIDKKTKHGGKKTDRRHENKQEKLPERKSEKPVERKMERTTDRMFYEDEDEEINLEKTCLFCEKRDGSFTSEGLDLHYWKDCPMLTHCSNCKQVVEIAGLTEHLLEECDAKKQYRQCPICLEAVPVLNFDNHIKIRTCTMAKYGDEANHCPLCHNNIAPGEKGWRNHLMGSSGCVSNPRRKDAMKTRRKSILEKKGEKLASLNKVASTVH